MVGGRTCRSCGAGLDRDGRSFDEYPPAGPYRYWTRTERGAIRFLAGGIVELLVAAVYLLRVLLVPGHASVLWYLAALFVGLLGIATAAIGTVSLHAHRRRPWPEGAAE